MIRKNHSKWLFFFALIPLLFLGWREAFVGGGAAVGPEVNSQQETTLGVILVPIEYRDEEWRMGEKGVQILPCEPPTPFVMGDPNGPVARIVDRGGKVLYTRKLPMDPRILLFEGPTEQENILKEVSFVLTIQLVEGANTLEYFIERGKDGTVEGLDPVLKVELGEAVERYFERGGRDQRAVCQEPEYVPDALKGEQ